MNKLFNSGNVKIVAEIAQSYEGKFDVLESIIEKVCATRVDGVMFQVIYADEIAIPENNNYRFFQSLEFTHDQWEKVISQIHEADRMAIGEVFGIKSAQMMFDMGIDALKIHTADLANLPLLRLVGQYEIALLIAIGASYEDEIEIAINEITKHGNPEIILMHGYQLSPTDVEDSKLLKIRALRDRFDLPVGFSDHIAGSINQNVTRLDQSAFILPLLAIALGAQLIEKHVILDRSKPWEDFESALTPEELKHLIHLVNLFSTAWGEEDVELNDAELEYRKTSKKHLVASRDLNRNHVLKEEDIIFKRIGNPEVGLINTHDLIGKSLLSSIKYNQPFTIDDIGGQ